MYICTVWFPKTCFLCFILLFSSTRFHLYKLIYPSPQFQIRLNHHICISSVEIFLALPKLATEIHLMLTTHLGTVRRPNITISNLCCLNSIFGKNNSVGFSHCNFQYCVVNLYFFTPILTIQPPYGNFQI